MTTEFTRRKIILGGHPLWIERSGLGALGFIYDSEKSQHPLLFDIMGSGENIWINDRRFTKEEQQELIDFLKKQ